MSSRQTPPAGESPPRLSVVARLVLAVLLVAAAFGLYSAIHSGLISRVRADATLKRETLDASIANVTVLHPQPTAPAEELVLPGGMQAFVAAPIFARTSGYLKKWYFDIGSHVKTGDLLAEIETPEIDRQLDQARADMATAQANYRLAQTTAERYQSLLKSDSVAKVGDLEAKGAIVDSAAFNVRRLQETQGFQKVYAAFDGVITARNTDIGDLIDAGANSPGKELFDLAATGRLRVYVNVPQTYSRAATVGKAADLTLAEFPSFRRRNRPHGGLHRSGVAHAVDRGGCRKSHWRTPSRRLRVGPFAIGSAGSGRGSSRQHADLPLPRAASGGGAQRQSRARARGAGPRFRK
jgi:multidrug efflux pump subunit AcrA (membrane-fusion protein)